MILTSVVGLNPGSHRTVEVRCDFGLSPKCRGKYPLEYRVALEHQEKHDGRIMCSKCYQSSELQGRKNPNARHNIDDGLLSDIDTEDKAYLLGWIASDGSVSSGSISVEVNADDYSILKTLADIVGLKPKVRSGLVGFTVNSKRMVSDICGHLSITPGKKSHTVGFPVLSTEALSWAFVRGVFDGDGCVSAPACMGSPRADICSSSDAMRTGIREFCKIPCSEYGGDRLEWCGNRALDFMAKIYDGAKPTLRLMRKYERYLEWTSWVPSLSGKNGGKPHVSFRWARTVPNAPAPFKERASDSGWDLTILEKVNQVGDVEFYTTGIKVQPDFGWYFQLVPRSSITKTGYMLANSVGIVDRTYVGPVIVALRKINPKAQDLVLPVRLVQIIPAPIIHIEPEWAEELSSTERGEGGFGSTDAKP